MKNKTNGAMCERCGKDPFTLQYGNWLLCDACHKEACDNEWALQPLDDPPPKRKRGYWERVITFFRPSTPERRTP